MTDRRKGYATSVAVALIVGTVSAYVGYRGYVLDWDDLNDWLQRHDLQLDIITVWCIAVCLTVWTLVKAYSWWVLWQTRDRTDVGRTMRPQKAAEVVMGLALATLYSLTLVAYYQHWSPEFWTRFALRVLLIAGTVGASVRGLRFAWALRATRNGGPSPPLHPPKPQEIKWKITN